MGTWSFRPGAAPVPPHSEPRPLPGRMPELVDVAAGRLPVTGPSPAWRARGFPPEGHAAGSGITPDGPPTPSHGSTTFCDWPAALGSIFSLSPVTVKNLRSSSPKRPGHVFVNT